MDFACIVFGIIFCTVGILFAKGKIHIYISSWKSMPQKEKDKVNIVPLCRNVGEVIGLSGILFLLNGFWTGFREHWFAASMIAWLIVAGLDVMYISKSARYEKTQKK